MAGPYPVDPNRRIVPVSIEDSVAVSTVKDDEDHLFREQSLEFQREILDVLKIIARQLSLITDEEILPSSEIGDI